MGPTCDDSQNNIRSASVLRKLQRILKGEHSVHVVPHLVGLVALHEENSNILLDHIFFKLLYSQLSGPLRRPFVC